MAIIKKSVGSVYQLPENLAALALADTNEATARAAGDLTEKTRAEAAELVLTTNLAAEVTRAAAAESVLDARITNVLSNTDPLALDSLTEIVAAYQAADGTLNGAITTLASAAGTSLTDEVARATAAEGVIATSLATETANRVEAVRLGSVLPKMEALTVASSKIVLTYAPKSGADGIMNFGRVSYVDVNNVENLADVTLDGTDATGKTFIVNTDAAGEWDTKSVKVQYWYIAAA